MSNSSQQVQATSSTTTFPTEVTKTIVFRALEQSDLDYLNNPVQDEDFIVDIKEHASTVGLEIVSIDGVEIK